MSPNARIIHNTLCDLPVDDRAAALVVALLERRADTVDAVCSLIGVIDLLTQNMSVVRRFVTAEILRDLADRVERCREEEVIARVV